MMDLVIDNKVKGITEKDFASLFEEYLHLDFITEEDFGVLITKKERELLA